MTLKLLTAPMPAIEAPYSLLQGVRSLRIFRAPRRGTEELDRSGHLALWGCHSNDVGFRCLSTTPGAVVAALKRDPHGQYLTAFQKPKWIPLF